MKASKGHSDLELAKHARGRNFKKGGIAPDKPSAIVRRGWAQIGKPAVRGVPGLMKIDAAAVRDELDVEYEWIDRRIIGFLGRIRQDGDPGIYFPQRLT
jgi:hypothetical protein